MAKNKPNEISIPRIQAHEVEVMAELLTEYRRISKIYPPLNSAHEGLSVLHEKMRGIEENVYQGKTRRDTRKMREEAVQVAATAMRFIVDVCDK